MRLTHWLDIIIIVVLALAIRAPLVPYSSGSDIPQFAGFTDTFISSSLCFYIDASSSVGEGWAYPWLYPYGPILVLLLAPLRLVCRTPITAYWEHGVYKVVVPRDWVVAVKAVLVVFDLTAAVILYRILLVRAGVRRLYALIAGAAYAVNPMALYNSGIYGMTDGIVLALLLAAINSWGKPCRVGVLLALAVMTKPTALLPSLGLLLYSTREQESLYRIAACSLATLVIFMAPFIATCPQTLDAIAYTLKWRASPSYTLPLVYSLNGFSSLATYLHETRGVETLWAIRALWLASLPLLAPLLRFTLRVAGPPRHLHVYHVAFAWYQYLLIASWSVNPQYLVVLVGLALLVVASPSSTRARIPALLLLSWASLWPLLYPLDFWFHVHIHPVNWGVADIISKFVLYTPSDLGYTIYSLVLSLLEVASLLTLTTLKPQRDAPS